MDKWLWFKVTNPPTWFETEVTNRLMCFFFIVKYPSSVGETWRNHHLVIHGQYLILRWTICLANTKLSTWWSNKGHPSINQAVSNMFGQTHVNSDGMLDPTSVDPTVACLTRWYSKTCPNAKGTCKVERQKFTHFSHPFVAIRLAQQKWWLDDRSSHLGSGWTFTIVSSPMYKWIYNPTNGAF